MSNPLVNLSSQIPESILNDSENFVLFLKAYYEWMHTSTIVLTNITGTFVVGEIVQGQTSGAKATIKHVNTNTNSIVVLISSERLFEGYETIIGLSSSAFATLDSFSDNILRKSSNLIDYRNIAKSADKFSEYLRDELYANFPLTMYGEDRLVARKLKDYYSSRGQEESFKFLFRTLFNQESEISYPGDEILIVSDGRFNKETILRTNLIGDPGSDDIFFFLFKTIRGVSSGALANVIDMKKIFVGSTLCAEMRLELVFGNFLVGENIYDVDDKKIPRTEATLYGLVSGYDIIDPGSGYQPGDYLTVTGDGYEASAQVSDVSTAEIDSIKVHTYGHGYRLGTLSTVNNSGTGGSGLLLKVTGITNTYPVTISANTYTLGEVTEITVINKGSDYYSEPIIYLTDTLVANAGLLTDKYINITNGGNTYSVGDYLVFSGPPGYGANAEVASVNLNGETAQTNYVRNSRALGAVSGSPGTAPTNWSVSTGANLDYQVVGSGVEDNIGYVDVRFFGNNASGSIQYSNVRFEAINFISTSPNTVWTSSVHLRRVSGATANVANTKLIMTNYSSSNVALNQFVETSVANLESTTIAAKRVSVTSSNTSFSNTSTAYIVPYIQFQVADNRIIDITLRIGGPQAELSNIATSLITTTGSVQLRPSNEANNDYSIYLENGDKLLDENTEFLKYDTTNTAIAVWSGIGKISRVKMNNFGADYQSNNLPSITVSTNTGSGANLVCVAIQGTGANVEVDTANNTQNIGGIRRIEPLSFGLDYTSANVSIVGVGNENAVVNGVISSLASTSGVFDTDDGKLNYKRIQDSYYYQKFSYVVNCGIELTKYKETLKRLLHPAGLEVFGQLSIINTIDATMQSDSFLFVDQVSQVIKKIIKYLDNVTVTKVIDFIVDEEYATFADLEISVLANNFILNYDKSRFNSQYGTPIYYQIEKNVKIPGTVNVYTSNNVIEGNGTSFTDYFSPGYSLVINDKLITNTTHKLVVDTVSSDTVMTVKVSPAFNLSNSDIYSIEV